VSRYKQLYSVEALPVLQNRTFSSKDEAMNCTKGNIDLVQDMATGLIFNLAFRPELLEYDSNFLFSA
jgi:hypothetical protein